MGHVQLGRVTNPCRPTGGQAAVQGWLSKAVAQDPVRKLKQDLHSAPASFEESTVAPSPAVRADGTHERRINPRYKCEGSAEFRTEGSDVRTGARSRI